MYMCVCVHRPLPSLIPWPLPLFATSLNAWVRGYMYIQCMFDIENHAGSGLETGLLYMNMHVHVHTRVHLVCIVDREDIDDHHLQKPCGVTSHQFILPHPVVEPEVKQAIARTFKHFNPTWVKSMSDDPINQLYSDVLPEYLPLVLRNQSCLTTYTKIVV